MSFLVRVRFGVLTLLLLLGAFLPVRAARADVYLLAQESLNGRATTQTQHWFGDDKSARDDGHVRTVMRFDLGRMYVISRNTRTYRSLPLPNAPPLSMTISQTADAVLILNRAARRWRVGGPAAHGLDISLWVSAEIGRGDAFVELMRKLARQAGAEWLNAYSEIDGFPLAQEISLSENGMTQTRRSEVISYKLTDPPADTYLPPRGYKRVL